MSLPFVFVVALLTLGLLVRRLMHTHRNGDAHYAGAVHAVLRQVMMQGTVNRRQVQAMLAVSDQTALDYLTRMERDGLIRRHGHDGFKTFYTRL